MQKHSNSTRIVSLLLAFLLLFQQSGIAQTLSALDISSHFAGLGKSLDQDTFRPLHLRYLGYRSQDNSLKLLIDKGDFFRRSSFVISDSLKDKYQNKGKNLLSPSLSDSPSSLSGSSSSLSGSSMSLSGLTGQSSPDDNTRLQSETSKLLNYLLIGLSLPNSSFWVNLRPDSPDNIIDNELAKTDIGKIMLEADLQLKKDTALLTSPSTPQGRLYWDRLYKKAEELYGAGNTNITIPTLTRPWIVPGEIIIREAQDNAYIYKATLKVLLEEDYLSQTLNSKPETLNKLKTRNSKAQNQQDKLKQLNSYSSSLLKELILPELNRRVNSSKDYAPLRQAYYSLILAQWFKSSLVVRDSGFVKDKNLARLVNSQDLTGLASKEPWSIHTYFQQYQKSFKEGEYNLKETMQTPFGQTIRSYFSGGMSFDTNAINSAIQTGMVVQGKSNIDFAGILASSAINQDIISARVEGERLEIILPEELNFGLGIAGERVLEKQAKRETAQASSAIFNLIKNIEKNIRKFINGVAGEKRENSEGAISAESELVKEVPQEYLNNDLIKKLGIVDPMAFIDSFAVEGKYANAIYPFVSFPERELNRSLEEEKIEQLTESLEFIRELIEDEKVKLAQLKEIIEISGGNIKAACRSLNQLKEVITAYGLDDIVELAKMNRLKYFVKMIGTQAKDEFCEFVEYKDLFIKYGVKIFILFQRIAKESEGIRFVFGTSFKETSNFIRELGDIPEIFGMETVCAALEAARTVPAPAHLFVIRSKEEIFKDAADFLRDLKNRASDSFQAGIVLNNRVTKEKNLIAGKILLYKASFVEYGIENILLFTESNTLNNVSQALSQLRPLIEQFGQGLVITLSARFNRALTRLLELDAEVWTGLFLQQGKIKDGHTELTELYLRNLPDIYSFQNERRISLLGEMLNFKRENIEVNFVEEFLLSKTAEKLLLYPELKVKLGSYFSKKTSNVRKNLLVRSLFWLCENGYEGEAGDIAYHMIAYEKKDLVKALNFIPALIHLRQTGMFDSEILAAIRTGDALKAIPEQLVSKIESVFGVKFETIHLEAKDSFDDYNFIIDLFQFQSKYYANRSINPYAYEILKGLVKAYFEKGAQGVIEYKTVNGLPKDFSDGRALEFEERTLEGITGKFAKLCKFRVSEDVESEERNRSLFEEFFGTTLENYTRHLEEFEQRQKQVFDPKKIEIIDKQDSKNLQSRIRILAEEAADSQLKEATDSYDLDRLKQLDFKDSKNRSLRNQAMGLIKKLQTVEQLEQEVNILGEATEIIKKIESLGKKQTTKEFSLGEQKEEINQLSVQYIERISQLIPLLRAIQQKLEAKNKPESNIVGDMIGLLIALQEVSSYKPEVLSRKGITAEVSFDLKETLKIGRYGASGAGNCQNSNGNFSYNQGLMSFIGNASELIILFKDTREEVIGFVLFHGVYISSIGDLVLEKKEFAYVKERVYTNNNLSADIQERLSKKMAQVIATFLGTKVLLGVKTAGSEDTQGEDKQDSKLEIEIPGSYVSRYLDSLGGSLEPVSLRTTKSITTEEIIVPQTIETIKEFLEEKNSSSAIDVTNRREPLEAIKVDIGLDNAYDKRLRIILSGPQVSQASRQRQQALAEIGPEAVVSFAVKQASVSSSTEHQKDGILERVNEEIIIDGETLNLSDFYELMEEVREQLTNKKGVPLIGKIYYSGSAFYLQREGRVKIDKIDDLDIVLILNRNAYGRARKVKNVFLKRLTEILTQRNIAFEKKPVFRKQEIENLHTDLSGLKVDLEELFEAQEVILHGKTRNISIEISAYFSFDKWAEDLYKALKDRLNFLGWDLLEGKMIDSAEKFIKKYIEMESLIGDLDMAVKYREKFLSSQSGLYPDIRAEIEKSGRVEKLKLDFDVSLFKERLKEPWLRQMSSQEKNAVASSVVSGEELGGVDFTAMPTVAQGGVAGMGQVHLSSSSSGLIGGSTGRSRLDCPIKSDNDKPPSDSDESPLGNDNRQEWAQIERLTKAGIVPSSERIKECFASSSLDLNSLSAIELGRIFSCIIEILRLEEDRVLPTDDTLKEFLARLR